MNLLDLGITKDGLYETIITTFHEDSTPNAAPMGVYGKGRDELALRVHKKTDTYVNIMRSKCCVINLVYDPLIFLRCSLYGRNKGPLEVEHENTKRAGQVNAPYLNEALAFIETELKSCEEVEKKDELGVTTIAKMVLKVKYIKILSPFPPAPNRGFFAAIELAISLSRGGKGDNQRYLDIIKKTATPDDYNEILDLVNEVLA
jgi:hypothetical protein